MIVTVPCGYCESSKEGKGNEYYQYAEGLETFSNVHRIYIRSKDKGRKFIPIASYCTSCGLFEPANAWKESFNLSLRVQYNVKTTEEAHRKVFETMGPKYAKLLGKAKEAWNS
jgi:hypothetical protein